MNSKKKVILIILSGLCILGLLISSVFLYYKSQNKTNVESSNNAIAVSDTESPTLVLSAKFNDNGDYFINLVREIDTNNFDPLSLIESVTDNVSKSENIIVKCDTELDITKSTQYLSYIATDESGNSTVLKLLVIYSDDPDKIREDQLEQIDQMEEEIARLEAEEQARKEEEERLRKEAEEAAKKEQEQSQKQESVTTPTTSGSSQPEKPVEPPKPPVHVYHNVNDFTISSSGDLQAELQNGAMANCSYGGCGGILGAFSFDMNGNTVTIHWTCTCGWTGTSNAIIQ